MKYYVTADTHGYYSILEAALRDTGFFDDPQPHKLIILGDLMDRGREAAQMQSFVLDLLSKGEIILIRGNHEDLFETLVTEDAGMPYSYHVQNGTYDTALQLTGYDKVMAQVRNRAFAAEAMETPYYKVIMPAMLDYYETEHYVFTHGWIPCVKDQHSYCHIDNWREAGLEKWREARWINGMAAATTAADDKTVVCGHWHASFGHSKIEGKCSEFGSDADFSPYYGSGVIGLDACTAHTRQVNILIIEDSPLAQQGDDHR